MFECREKVAVCGHRGQRIHGMENTMEEISAAVELGVDMIETDIRMSRDGSLFLVHNKELADHTDGQGQVRDHSYEELRSMNAAKHAIRTDTFSPPEHANIATLDELLEYAQDKKDLLLNLELKEMPSDDEEWAFSCADKVCSQVVEKGLGSRSWINCFSGKVVQRAHERFGDQMHYHAFYPWYIMGPMEESPWNFCDIACMLNWPLDKSGKIIKTGISNPCPDSWFSECQNCGVMPLTTSFYPTLEDYYHAYEMGSRIMMADDPKKILDFFRLKGLHS